MPLRLLILLLILPTLVAGQATLREAIRTLPTYPFGDPDRVPILVDRSDLYPYHRYEGYSLDREPADWTVVTLANEHIEVSVLPEVGGKVWGAIDKANGEEFIYRNEVMKFRNIAMRGPWTSGGIEFNFGIIGHHPGTATPVDYLTRENPDGSVSCFVGALDLPSRSSWRVEIRLAPGEAAFETRALWYNDGPLHQSYYNWMTAAAAARDDLEFYTPGDAYLDHPGDAHPWPTDDAGRDLAAYDQNAFGPSKSYHVVGSYDHFFGGYYRDSDFGFGHWARHDEMPGQKLWLWSQARSGAIWEDLLTDDDGQYIEFQAGRLLNQYAASGRPNPITDAAFPPHSADSWRERWFPVRAIGGLGAASPHAVLHVAGAAETRELRFFGLRDGEADVYVTQGDDTLFWKSIDLRAGADLALPLDLPNAEPYVVRVPAWGLTYFSDPERRALSRPFTPTPEVDPGEADQAFRQGLEAMDRRAFGLAREHFAACLASNPAHLEALAASAELAWRAGQYAEARDHALRALAYDTYHPYANYVAGLAFRATGQVFDALDALGWAARSTTFRSAAYVEMAAIQAEQGRWSEAAHYAREAQVANGRNLTALDLGAVAARYLGHDNAARAQLDTLLAIDPLHHFARAEAYLADPNPTTELALRQPIQQELAYQVYLELALRYASLGLPGDALRILDLAPEQPLLRLWRAYLQRERAPDAAAAELLAFVEAPPDLVFPFRSETLEALEWAAGQNPSWKPDYYLALGYWGKGRLDEARQRLDALGDEPDYAPFYLARAHLRQRDEADPLPDLRRAHALEPGEWRTWTALLAALDDPDEARRLGAEARQRFPENSNVNMAYVRVLQDDGKYAESLDVLDRLQVLPFEGASEGHRLYERANLAVGMDHFARGEHQLAAQFLIASKEWPERLGVGKPYDPDERLADYLLYHAYTRLGEPELAELARDRLLGSTRRRIDRGSPLHLLGLELMPPPQAQMQLEAWRQAGADTPAATRWAMARYADDGARARELEAQGRRDGWLDGPDADLFLRALERTED